MRLGATISRLRAEKKLSQGELADALGVSRQSVSKWETDASIPELDKLMELRKNYLFKSGDAPIYAADGDETYRLGAAAPILSPGDLMGCVMLLRGEKDGARSDCDQSIVKTAAGLLGRQMES